VQAGLRITGRTPDGTYVEVVEVPGHPWFLGCQFHPEFKSKPLAPHPLFAAFIAAAREHRNLARSAGAVTQSGATTGVAVPAEAQVPARVSDPSDRRLEPTERAQAAGNS